MPSSPLSQLIGLGIPRGRAQAALKLAKGDAMSAAEKVFGGELDDIPSDDEGDDATLSNGHASSSVQDSGLEKVMSSSRMGVHDFVDEDVADEGAIFDTETGDRLMSDPYDGVFFSKDRIETVIESSSDPRFVEIPLPKGGFGTQSRVRTLSRGEWMSGCPEEGEQSHLFQLYHLLEENVPCPSRCGYTFPRSPDDFFLLLPDFNEYTNRLKTIIRPECPKCATQICLACGEALDRRPLKHLTAIRTGSCGTRPGEKLSAHEELLHCLPVQGILIGVGLYVIERVFDGPKASLAANDTVISAKKRKSRSPLQSWKQLPGGTYKNFPDEDSDEPYYTSEKKLSARGVGYAGSMNEDRSGQLAAERAQIAVDKQAAKLLSQVRVYLPDVNRAGGARTSDVLVHPTALAHLRRRSAFIHDMLRNDSLLDMSNRRAVYGEIFDWLEAVSSHESLASMLAMPQMRPTSSIPDPNDPKQRVVTYEGSSSPRELLESCVIQATAALKGLKAMSENLGASELQEEAIAQAHDAGNQPLTEENERLRSFCERILRSADAIDRSLVETKGQVFVDRMKATLPSLDAADDIRGEEIINQDDEAIVKLYEDWASRARFQYCDLSNGQTASGSKIYHHAFNDELRNLERADAPKRSLVIAKELAILTRNLPVAWHSSIFLRADETRVDCLKAMIIGPEGTPYENGCFIFDIFLPLEYNFKSPSVKSMTTNGGRYRYNPNLYADGKVCLSLLGTWQGPGWISGQSTLLQVLISIQSLILCEEPYLNEPAYHADGGSPRSQAYSANVRRMVMMDAMVNNIRRPPRPFQSEIHTHFRLKTRYIKKQLSRWKLLDDGKPTQDEGYTYSLSLASAGQMPGGGPSQTAFDRAAEAVEKALGELEEGTLV